MKSFFSLVIVLSILLTLFSSCGKAPLKEALTITEERNENQSTIKEKPEKIEFTYAPEGVAIQEREFPDLDLSGMNEAQKALVTTAESYLIRGSRAQYEDTRILATGNLSHYRWAVNQRSPEEYTSQNLGFLQCAAFCYEVYRNALDLELIYEGKTCYYTSRFESYAKKVLHERPVDSKFSELSDTALEQKKQEFLNALQPGDIIVYRVKTNGHAMLYVGNGKVIHSSGNLYNWEQKKEVFEEEGTVRMDDVTFLFDEGTGRYLFSKLSYFIVRPLNDFDIQVPEKSKTRMNQMRGVLAEKLSSHPCGVTANPGEEIVFTYSFLNKSEVEKSLRISDTVPNFTQYVSGDFQWNGTELSADFKLAAGEKKILSYTVMVKEETSYGSAIKSRSFVGGIPLNCPEIIVAKTLTKEEQKKISDAVDELYASENQSLFLVNEIYQKALGKKAFDTDSASDVLEDLFRCYSLVTENNGKDAMWSKAWRTLDSESKLLSSLVPNFYGGRYVPEGTTQDPLSDLEWFHSPRVRYLSASHLVAGDIILIGNNTQNFMTSAFLYTGEDLLNLGNNTRVSPEPRLSQIIAEKAFVVLRPSMAV